jgi:polyferredoxin/ferredoxin
VSIITVRRIAQVFFFVMFLWFCVASTFGTEWWQLRGWPINLFLNLDPLVGAATVLSTHTLYKGLLWGLLTVVVTLLLGRVFCGWVCPFGTLHQFFGWLGMRGRKLKQRFAANEYRSGQVVKYYILTAFLVLAALPIGGFAILQTGLLDPIPLVHRSVNLALLPIAESLGRPLSAVPRLYDGAWLIGGFFIAMLLMNFVIPRFFCRFVCPTGALLGLLSRFAVLRIHKKSTLCTHCELCQTACEGACEPAEKIRLSECLMCMNCLDDSCAKNFLTFGVKPSIEGDGAAPDPTKRGLLVAAGASVMALPLLRVGGVLGPNWDNRNIRPPGSLEEGEFLERCIKCGQCMRVCPTNVIMPAGLDRGVEQLWTPVLNFRIGTSGCQLNCVACGHVCPTAAIRPLTLDEKHGTGAFADKGPLRIGTAFVDRGRCLPWAMDTPCIVCQENCPVTPKAIFVREIHTPLRGGALTIAGGGGGAYTVSGIAMKPAQYATGDYYLAAGDGEGTPRHRITANTADSVTVAGDAGHHAGDKAHIVVRLQAPCVDISQCIGCGVCEHECPVSGLRAIRITAENESRSASNSLTLERGRSQ